MKKLARKEKSPFLSTEEENLSEKTVAVKFIITVPIQKKLGKSKGCEKWSNMAYSEAKTIHRRYGNNASLSSLREDFFHDKEMLSDDEKSHEIGFLGFETIPYNYDIQKLINQSPSNTF